MFKYCSSSKCEFLHSIWKWSVMYEIQEYEDAPKFPSDEEQGKIPRLWLK